MYDSRMNEYAYQITADSGCDLSLEKCREINVVPYHMPFTMDGNPMVDGMTEESFREFYDLMRAGGVAKTSQINPGEFLEFWRPYAERGLDVLHISLGAAISGSCANAVSAAGMLMDEFPGWHCRVVDSTSASAGFGLIVMNAAAWRDAGLGLEENAAKIEATQHEVQAIFTTNDLTYLYRGGRVSRTSAAFGTALKIVPIMHLDYAGHLEVWQKVRGDKACLRKMVQDVKELAVDPESQTLVISEADCPEKAREFGEAINAECHFKDIFYTHIGPIIGAHTGPGLVAVFFVGKTRE